MSVSRETSERLADFAELVRKWTRRINLIAPATVVDINYRHIDDCLQLAELAAAKNQSWCDLGSGGGFPGIVVGIATQDKNVPITLIESDKRKAVFLKTAIHHLGLDRIEVVNQRIEAVTPQKASIVSARALAPLPKLMAYVHQHLADDGAAWLMKGARWQDEVSEAKNSWQFNIEPFASRTDPAATILNVTQIKPL